jgi:hypothetical protein
VDCMTRPAASHKSASETIDKRLLPQRLFNDGSPLPV